MNINKYKEKLLKEKEKLTGLISEMTENEARKELQNALGYQDLDKHTI